MSLWNSVIYFFKSISLTNNLSKMVIDQVRAGNFTLKFSTIVNYMADLMLWTLIGDVKINSQFKSRNDSDATTHKTQNKNNTTNTEVHFLVAWHFVSFELFLEFLINICKKCRKNLNISSGFANAFHRPYHNEVCKARIIE